MMNIFLFFISLMLVLHSSPDFDFLLYKSNLLLAMYTFHLVSLSKINALVTGEFSFTFIFPTKENSEEM